MSQNTNNTKKEYFIFVKNQFICIIKYFIFVKRSVYLHDQYKS